MSELFRVDSRHVQEAASILEGNYKLFARWLKDTRVHAPEVTKIPKKCFSEAYGTMHHTEQDIQEELKKTGFLVSVITCALWLAHNESYPEIPEDLFDRVMKEPTPYSVLESELRHASEELYQALGTYAKALGVSQTGQCIALVLAVSFIRSARGVVEPIAKSDEAIAVEEAMRLLGEKPPPKP